MQAKVKKVWFYAWWLVRFSLETTISLVISLPLRLLKKYDDIWLISERPDEARDNGYWLYEWILKEHPEINVRYVLSNTSPDYEKISRKDLIIEPGTFKHHIHFILAAKAISTHMHGASPGRAFCVPFLPLMRKKQTIFLQHGVIKDAIPLRRGIDIVIASAEKEAKLITKANPSLKDNIRITGLCRYDQLIDSRKDKIILVMPTFRRQLRDISRLKNAEAVFAKTEYYNNWNSLLNSQRLNKILIQYDAKLIFYPHHEIQPLLEAFNAESPRVIVASQAKYSVQQLLKDASVLITDYSSVFYDFAYMGKPVLFYQFDDEAFFSHHYRSSGEQYPFGNISANEEDLLTELEKTCYRGMRAESKYSSDVKKFFKYHDQNNTERNFDAIMEAKGENK